MERLNGEEYCKEVKVVIVLTTQLWLNLIPIQLYHLCIQKLNVLSTVANKLQLPAKKRK